MADLDIAEIDLAKGIKTKNIVVPPMIAKVVIVNAPPGLDKAFAKEKVAAQKVMAAAFEQLKKSQVAVAAAIADFDAGLDQKPPADKADAAERAKTFNTVCKQIAEAQSGAAVKAATTAWAVETKKVKDLQSFRIGFALRTTLGAISIAASIASAALSMGALAITIVGAAKTVASMAADIYNFCRDMDKAEGDIIKTDAVLAKTWTSPGVDFKKAAREIATALGAPFTASIGVLEKVLKEYNAKNGSKDEKAEKMYAKARELMAAIEKAPKSVSPAQQAALKALGTKVDELLSSTGTLSALSKSNDLFYSTYAARLTTYQDMRGARLGGAASATGALAVIAGVAATAKTIGEIALKLA